MIVKPYKLNKSFVELLYDFSDEKNYDISLSVSSLSIQIMQRIKQEYSYLNNIKLENLNLEYFGNYNGYYALIMYDITTGVAAVVTKVEIGDVVFYYPTTGIEIIMCKIN